MDKNELVDYFEKSYLHKSMNRKITDPPSNFSNANIILDNWWLTTNRNERSKQKCVDDCCKTFTTGQQSSKSELPKINKLPTIIKEDLLTSTASSKNMGKNNILSLPKMERYSSSAMGKFITDEKFSEFCFPSFCADWSDCFLLPKCHEKVELPIVCKDDLELLKRKPMRDCTDTTIGYLGSCTSYFDCLKFAPLCTPQAFQGLKTQRGVPSEPVPAIGLVPLSDVPPPEPVITQLLVPLDDTPIPGVVPTIITPGVSLEVEAPGIIPPPISPVSEVVEEFEPQVLEEVELPPPLEGGEISEEELGFEESELPPPFEDVELPEEETTEGQAKYYATAYYKFGGNNESNSSSSSAEFDDVYSSSSDDENYAETTYPHKRLPILFSHYLTDSFNNLHNGSLASVQSFDQWSKETYPDIKFPEIIDKKNHLLNWYAKSELKTPAHFFASVNLLDQPNDDKYKRLTQAAEYGYSNNDMNFSEVSRRSKKVLTNEAKVRILQNYVRMLDESIKSSGEEAAAELGWTPQLLNDIKTDLARAERDLTDSKVENDKRAIKKFEKVLKDVKHKANLYIRRFQKSSKSSCNYCRQDTFSECPHCGRGERNVTYDDDEHSSDDDDEDEDTDTKSSSPYYFGSPYWNSDHYPYRGLYGELGLPVLGLGLGLGLGFGGRTYFSTVNNKGGRRGGHCDKRAHSQSSGSSKFSEGKKKYKSKAHMVWGSGYDIEHMTDYSNSNEVPLGEEDDSNWFGYSNSSTSLGKNFSLSSTNGTPTSIEISINRKIGEEMQRLEPIYTAIETLFPEQINFKFNEDEKNYLRTNSFSLQIKSWYNQFKENIDKRKKDIRYLLEARTIEERDYNKYGRLILIDLNNMKNLLSKIYFFIKSKIDIGKLDTVIEEKIISTTVYNKEDDLESNDWKFTIYNDFYNHGHSYLPAKSKFHKSDKHPFADKDLLKYLHQSFTLADANKLHKVENFDKFLLNEHPNKKEYSSSNYDPSNTFVHWYTSAPQFRRNMDGFINDPYTQYSNALFGGARIYLQKRKVKSGRTKLSKLNAKLRGILTSVLPDQLGSLEGQNERLTKKSNNINERLDSCEKRNKSIESDIRRITTKKTTTAKTNLNLPNLSSSGNYSNFSESSELARRSLSLKDILLRDKIASNDTLISENVQDEKSLTQWKALAQKLKLATDETNKLYQERKVLMDNLQQELFDLEESNKILQKSTKENEKKVKACEKREKQLRKRRKAVRTRGPLGLIRRGITVLPGQRVSVGPYRIILISANSPEEARNLAKSRQSNLLRNHFINYANESLQAISSGKLSKVPSFGQYLKNNYPNAEFNDYDTNNGIISWVNANYGTSKIPTKLELKDFLNSPEAFESFMNSTARGRSSVSKFLGGLKEKTKTLSRTVKGFTTDPIGRLRTIRASRVTIKSIKTKFPSDLNRNELFDAISRLIYNEVERIEVRQCRDILIYIGNLKKVYREIISFYPGIKEKNPIKYHSFKGLIDDFKASEEEDVKIAGQKALDSLKAFENETTRRSLEGYVDFERSNETIERNLERLLKSIALVISFKKNCNYNKYLIIGNIPKDLLFTQSKPMEIGVKRYLFADIFTKKSDEKYDWNTITFERIRAILTRLFIEDDSQLTQSDKALILVYSSNLNTLLKTREFKKIFENSCEDFSPLKTKSWIEEIKRNPDNFKSRVLEGILSKFETRNEFVKDKNKRFRRSLDDFTWIDLIDFIQFAYTISKIEKSFSKVFENNLVSRAHLNEDVFSKEKMGVKIPSNDFSRQEICSSYRNLREIFSSSDANQVVFHLLENPQTLAHLKNDLPKLLRAWGDPRSI